MTGHNSNYHSLQRKIHRTPGHLNHTPMTDTVMLTRRWWSLGKQLVGWEIGQKVLMLPWKRGWPVKNAPRTSFKEQGTKVTPKQRNCEKSGIPQHWLGCLSTGGCFLGGLKLQNSSKFGPHMGQCYCRSLHSQPRGSVCQMEKG